METKQRIKIFIISLITSLIALRLFLYAFPSSNLNLGKYNIHHLFIGSFLVVVLLIFFILNIVNRFAIILSGISSALVLDEIIYLIATDGSDVSYLTAVSFWGSIVMTLIILVLTIILYNLQKYKLKE